MGEFLPAPKSFDEAYNIAKTLAKSHLVPSNFKNNPDDVIVAMMWSANLGVPFVQGLQGIGIINGRATIWGDLALAVCRNTGKLEYIKEFFEGEGRDLAAVCQVKRTDEANIHEWKFSMIDATTAGLVNKQGPWKSYPKRMLQLRARGFALRDAFAEALMGMITREEAEDMESVVNGDGEVVQVKKTTERKMPTRKSKPVENAEDATIAEQPKIENNPTELPETIKAATQGHIHKTQEPEPIIEEVEEVAEQTGTQSLFDEVPEEPEIESWQLDVETKLTELTTIDELKAFFKSLPQERKIKVKEAFSARRRELESKVEDI